MSGCNFTFVSFQSFLDMLSRSTVPLSLVLPDLSMPAAHWRQLWDVLGSLPKLSCLRELDWSGNSLASAAIPDFVAYFFPSNPIGFLALDRVFWGASIKDFETLIKLLPEKSIWGLSLGGSVDSNFSGYFKPLTQLLGGLKGLSALHLNGQKLTDSDLGPLFDYLSGHKELIEFSCDGTSISSDATFFDVYKRLEQRNTAAIGRPYRDFQQIAARGGSGLLTGANMTNLRSSLHKRFPATTRIARAVYLGFLESPADFRINELHDLGARFPRCFAPFDQVDQYGLNRLNVVKEAASLCLLNGRRPTQSRQPFVSLANIHAGFVQSPELAPKYVDPLLIEQREGAQAGEAELLIAVDPPEKVEELRSVLFKLVGDYDTPIDEAAFEQQPFLRTETITDIVGILESITIPVPRTFARPASAGAKPILSVLDRFVKGIEVENVPLVEMKVAAEEPANLDVSELEELLTTLMTYRIPEKAGRAEGGRRRASMAGEGGGRPAEKGWASFIRATPSGKKGWALQAAEVPIEIRVVGGRTASFTG
jgi:hypothetical protein